MVYIDIYSVNFLFQEAIKSIVLQWFKGRGEVIIQVHDSLIDFNFNSHFSILECQPNKEELTTLMQINSGLFSGGPKATIIFNNYIEALSHLNKLNNFNGFLTKDCDKQEIHDCLVKIQSNKKFYCEKLITKPHISPCEGTALSAREIQVIQYVAKGFSTKEVADLLNISYHTVHTHRKNTMRKLEVSSASELTLKAVQLGIL